MVDCCGTGLFNFLRGLSRNGHADLGLSENGYPQNHGLPSWPQIKFPNMGAYLFWRHSHNYIYMILVVNQISPWISPWYLHGPRRRSPRWDFQWLQEGQRRSWDLKTETGGPRGLRIPSPKFDETQDCLFASELYIGCNEYVCLFTWDVYIYIYIFVVCMQ